MLPPLQRFSPNGKVDQQLIIVVNATRVFVVFTDQFLVYEECHHQQHCHGWLSVQKYPFCLSSVLL